MDEKDTPTAAAMPQHEDIGEPTAVHGVRIVGATQPGASLSGEREPVAGSEARPGAVTEAGTDEREGGSSGYSESDAVGPGGGPAQSDPLPGLQHWTEPGTGQVPSYLEQAAVAGDRDESGKDPVEALRRRNEPGPAWREHDHEWDAVNFEPALLSDDDTRMGVLDETPLEERQPWEFDDVDLKVAGDTEPEMETQPRPRPSVTISSSPLRTRGGETKEGRGAR